MPVHKLHFSHIIMQTLLHVYTGLLVYSMPSHTTMSKSRPSVNAYTIVAYVLGIMGKEWARSRGLMHVVVAVCIYSYTPTKGCYVDLDITAPSVPHSPSHI